MAAIAKDRMGNLILNNRFQQRKEVVVAVIDCSGDVHIGEILHSTAIRDKSRFLERESISITMKVFDECDAKGIIIVKICREHGIVCRAFFVLLTQIIGNHLLKHPQKQTTGLMFHEDGMKLRTLRLIVLNSLLP